jgi:hypothetical protein
MTCFAVTMVSSTLARDGQGDGRVCPDGVPLALATDHVANDPYLLTTGA